MKLRVLVVDDQELVQLGLRLLLGRQPWVARCLSAADGGAAVALAERYSPHVALLDIDLASEPAPDVARRLRAASRSTRILLLTEDDAPSSAALRAAGALGAVGKCWPSHAILEAVRAAASGRAVRRERRSASPLLSRREREVLDLMAGGATNREIALSLGLSPHTVKQHASAAFRKLSARNRADAVSRGQRLGLIC